MLSSLPSLYRMPPGTCCWGGSTPDVGSGLSQAAQQGAGTIQQMLNQAKGYVQPWQQAGTGAIGQIAGLLGLPGYASLDPTKTLEGTPGYQFLLNQGNQALARYGASTGLSLSGPAAKSAQTFGQDTAQTYAWAPYMSNLMGVSQSGLGAGATMGGWNMAGGSEIANLNMAAAQARAQQQIMEANNRNAGFSDILGGLGFGAGMLFGMPGVGSAIGSTVGNVFNPSPAMPAYSGYSSSGNPMSFPSFAEGGYTDSEPIMVGERGPEVFVPSVPGFIVPNYMLNYASYGGY